MELDLTKVWNLEWVQKKWKHTPTWSGNVWESQGGTPEAPKFYSHFKRCESQGVLNLGIKVWK